MHILGALDLPSSGTYVLDNQDVSHLEDDQLADIRNQKIGFIFQAYNLLPRTTALKNVMLPLSYAGVPYEKRLEKAKKYLKLVGLGDRMNHTSNQLSGGQQQRVAVARALITKPKIIIADEPLTFVDAESAQRIVQFFKKLREEGKTICISTHVSDLAQLADKTYKLKDGKIV